MTTTAPPDTPQPTPALTGSTAPTQPPDRLPGRAGDHLPDRAGDGIPEGAGDHLPARADDRIPDRAGGRGPARPVSPALISAHDVTKAYRAGTREVEILHGISLAVRPGEMCAVMGPSGSGKSTLLYCLAGLEQPSTGTVELLGQPTSRLSRSALARMRRSEVGFVFQSYNLVPTLSAFENVALPYRLRGERPPTDLVMETLATVGLEKLARSRPVLMSGGEQQRVALARVLAQRPRIVFADEPTGALDSHSGTVVLAELRAIAHRSDQCVLTVTHDPVVASECDRVLFLKDGYLVQELLRPTAAQAAELVADLGVQQEGAAR